MAQSPGEEIKLPKCASFGWFSAASHAGQLLILTRKPSILFEASALLTEK